MISGLLTSKRVKDSLYTSNESSCLFLISSSVVNTPTYHVMPRRKVNWAIWNALKLWSSVIPVSFRKVPSWQPADIVIKFASYYHGDSHPFDGPNGTIAHAYLPNGRFGDLDGDIHLDDSEAFNNHGRWGKFKWTFSVFFWFRDHMLHRVQRHRHTDLLNYVHPWWLLNWTNK